ncbi:MAG: small multi-drug export protein [Candidatus Kerfeldbacteria bacterium]|nr:small multi-drug export protein [Candidatus Kerfeldbacteria bacterium]
MLGINPLETFATIPHELAVFLIAMLPSLELSAAIPAGIGGWHLPWWKVYLLAVSGSLVPGIAILLFIEPIANILRRHSKIMNRFFTWLFEKTRKDFYAKHEKWGNAALLFFVAIPLPLPGSGMWSGALAAWLFGIPFHKAFPMLFGGILFAGVIATAITLGVFSFL